MENKEIYNDVLRAYYDSNYLSHHGVKGMKWGIRRFQNKDGTRTVLGKKHESDERKIARLNSLSKAMDSFEYGTIIDGKRYGEDDLDKVDWNKYKTLPVEIVAKEKIGNCWDFVNYQHSELDKAKIPNKSYLFMMARSDDPDDVVTHTFTIAKIDGQQKWLESAMWPKRGVHDVNGPEDVLNELTDVYGKNNYDLYEYDPAGMDKGLSGNEFIDRATSTDPLLQYKKR